MKSIWIIAAGALIVGIGAAMFAPQPFETGSYVADAAAETLTEQSYKVKHPTEIVELFTSQGCSSCPPADRFIASLADSPTTIALSFSVTYWDYLGWKDKFGRKDFTKRQKKYARALGVRNVYTPQIVLNGARHNSIFNREQVETSKLAEDRPLINVEGSGTYIKVQQDESINLEDYDLTLIAYQPGMQLTAVERGENRNRTLQNYNVVSGVYPLEAGNSYSIDTRDHPDGMAYVLFASEPNTAKILSATHISDN